jgi:hypothetical protein
MKHSAIILVLTVMGIIACSNDPVETNESVRKKRAVDAEKIKIDIFAKKACGATEPTIAQVKELIDQMDVSSELNIIMLKSHRQAIELKIPGVPTIRVNGVDIDPAADQIQKYGIT